MNQTVWDKISPPTRSRDLKFQRVQKSLTRGVSALLHSFPNADLSEAQHDALVLLCHANFELNNLRRELIKPDLKNMFSHLCKPSTPVTKYLFGDQLYKRVKGIRKEQSAAAGVVKTHKGASHSQTRYHPYSGPSGYPKRQYQKAGWTSESSTQPRRQTSNYNKPFLGQQQQWGRKQAPTHRPSPHNPNPSRSGRGESSYQLTPRGR